MTMNDGRLTLKDVGPIAPVVTPCERSGEIDFSGFRAVCREMVAAGCGGIFVAGSTGRGPWFTLAERVALCEAAAETVAGRAVLLAGCMASGVPGMLEAARAMAQAGADGAVATAPGYFRYDAQELESIFHTFADASPLPVVVYDIPEFTGHTVAVDTITHLARHGNVLGVKDSSADFERFALLSEVLRDFPEFALLQGKEAFLAASLRLGAAGFVVSLIHLDPESFVALYRAVRSGDELRADVLQAEVSAAIALVGGAIEKRPQSSTLFSLLDGALRGRGACDNLLLDHEGETPAWLAETAQGAVACFQTRRPAAPG